MDRIDAMKVFVTALDEGSLVGAARKLGHSPAAVSRAIAFLENHVGAPLLHRTTRTIRLSEAGERYAAACRRALVDLEEADMIVADEKSAPRGVLSITAPVSGGEMILREVIDAFMDAVPTVSVRLYLFDRPVNLIDEGHDVALRIAHLQDSTLTVIKVGEVRRIQAAAPAYLDGHPPITGPADLATHKIVAMSHFGLESWSFPPAPGAVIPRTVTFQPRLVVNSVRAAVASAVEGHGVTRLFSYHVAAELKAGALRLVLENDEPPRLPVNLITPHGRMAIPKVRAFVEFAAPRLKAWFETTR
jgi:DNA-binding transcriptional LysR family regulator